MIDEAGLRLFVGLELAIQLPVEAFFRVQSRVPSDKLDRTQEGLLMLVLLRLGLVVRLAALLVFVANPRWLAWSALPWPLGWRASGAGFALISLVLMIWVFRSLGRNLTDTVVARMHAALVTDGPYRWVRHPLYLSFGVAAIGDTLLTANWFVALADASILTLLVLRTGIEERHLVARFGDGYRTYCQGTGKYVPVLRPWKAGAP